MKVFVFSNVKCLNTSSFKITVHKENSLVTVNNELLMG